MTFQTRELSISELDFVSGGSYGGNSPLEEIVITGHSGLEQYSSLGTWASNILGTSTAIALGGTYIAGAAGVTVAAIIPVLVGENMEIQAEIRADIGSGLNYLPIGNLHY
jgi:hypothetical protein